MKKVSLVVRLIEHRILLIRGQKVLLDSDLADLYEVPTKRLNEQVTRNKKRFPPDFMFRLSKKEADSLRSQFATSNVGRGGRRYLPRVFTEQGIAMLSSVLNSDKAIDVNIAIMRAFVHVRQILETDQAIKRKLGELMQKTASHDQYIQVLFKELKNLTEGPMASRRKIGFK